MQKPAKTVCPHQCSAGCGIYPTRPSACAVYKCSWLAGQLPLWAKPDESGLFFETMLLPLKKPMPNGSAVLVMAWGEAVDVEKALSFESKWDDLFDGLCSHGVHVVSLGGLPEDRFPDGMARIASDQVAAGIYEQWIRAVRKNGGVDVIFADGEKENLEVSNEQGTNKWSATRQK